MIMFVRRGTTALLLTCALAGCAGVGSPATAEPGPTPALDLVDNLCAKLDHEWLPDEVEAALRIREFPRGDGEDRSISRCMIAGVHPESGQTFQLTASATLYLTPTEETAAPTSVDGPGKARPVDGVGDRATIQMNAPVEIGDADRPSRARHDVLTVWQGSAAVMFVMNVVDPSPPDDTAVEAQLVTYAKQTLELMAA